MNNTCPLCGKELVSLDPWQVCPVMVEHNVAGVNSHYYYGGATIWVYIDQYRIRIDTKIPLEYHVSRYSVGDLWSDNFGAAIIIPAFEIKSEEQLIKRLKTLLVFS